MSQKLSRRQAVLLGLVVLFAGGVGGAGLVAVAARQGLWADSVEVAVGFPDAHDLAPGTPVRVRGVPAGQVVAVEYPAHDGPGAAVTVRLRLDARYAGRLYADGSAAVHSTGLLGAKVIAVDPGTPAAGPLAAGTLRAVKPVELADAAAKLSAVADEAGLLLRELRTGTGTFAKLVKDDELYHDLKGLARDARTAVGRVEQEVAQVDGFVKDGKETLRSVKQGTDAMQRLPIVRGYVEDAAAILVRPTCRREGFSYNTADLFEPGTAILTDGGRHHLSGMADWLNGVNKDRSKDKAEVVVVAGCDPKAADQTPASAAGLTRKQAETAAEFLKGHGVHKLGWWTRRTVTPLGLGMSPSPAVEKEPLPPSYVRILLFTPQG